MGNGNMTARQKGDLYWRKRKRYLAAAAVKSGLNEGYINPDMAEDVLKCYKVMKDSTDKTVILTGNEFSERPPTAVGRRAFADSVANVMKGRDEYEKILGSLESKNSEAEEKVVIDGLRIALSAVVAVIDDYFTASGITQEGEKISDKEKRRNGLSAFFSSRELFHELITKKNKDIGIKYIEEIRDKYGLKEMMDVPDPGEGPVFGMLMARCPEAVESNKEQIEKLKSININARREAAQLVKARETLSENIKKEYFSEDADEMKKFLLETAFGDYSAGVDKRLGELLYIQEATAACAGWILAAAPVDPILELYIKPEWGVKPAVMREDMKLSEQEDFVYLKKLCRRSKLGKISSLSDVRDRAEEIKKYLYAHPWQFDAQCLITVSRGIEGLPDIIADADAIRKGLDALTAEGYLNTLKFEESIEFYEIWVLTDMVCRVGFTLMEFTIGHEDSTLIEAVTDIKKILPLMSYSKMEKQCREAVKKIMRNRTKINV